MKYSNMWLLPVAMVVSIMSCSLARSDNPDTSAIAALEKLGVGVVLNEKGMVKKLECCWDLPDSAMVLLIGMTSVETLDLFGSKVTD